MQSENLNHESIKFIVKAAKIDTKGRSQQTKEAVNNKSLMAFTFSPGLL